MLQNPLRSTLFLLLPLLLAPQASAIGFVLGQSKEELKLKYDVEVHSHDSGRVTIIFTLTDEGRLKPLDEVQLTIPAQEKNPDGSHWMDLVVSLHLEKTDNNTRTARIHLHKDLATRAQIQLNTHTMDGKLDPLTRLHHVIPIAKHMKPAPAAQPKPN